MGDLPTIDSIPTDLTPPTMVDGRDGPGLRVRRVAPDYRGTGVYHAVYLPVDWRPDGSFPLIVEYAGNCCGTECSGLVEDCHLGYGLSAGKGFIWVCLPFISADHQRNDLTWWGDVEATVAYCRRIVPDICNEYGGDRRKVILAGFSRGAIACNYIGLHDDKISPLWCAFVIHSHYDGVLTTWGYPDADRASARARLQRLAGRPQFISSEGEGVEATRQYLESELGPERPRESFTFMQLPYSSHTDTWVLRDIPERERVRKWLVRFRSPQVIHHRDRPSVK